MSDKAKYSYLAGIIDGEGCLTIGAGRKGTVTNYNSVIMVVNTSEKLIKWLVHNFGGNYYKSGRSVPNSKPAFIWRFLKHKDIELLLLAILPYLIIKREQALTLLEFVRLPRTAEPIVRQELHTKMSILNKRGLDSVTTNMQDLSEYKGVCKCGHPELHHTFVCPELKIESELIGDYESASGVIQIA
jgi:hypothetical protein